MPINGFDAKTNLRYEKKVCWKAQESISLWIWNMEEEKNKCKRVMERERERGLSVLLLVPGEYDTQLMVEAVGFRLLHINSSYCSLCLSFSRGVSCSSRLLCPAEHNLTSPGLFLKRLRVKLLLFMCKNASGSWKRIERFSTNMESLLFWVILFILG